MIVLDASAAVELLGDTATGRRILARLGGEGVLHAPHLLDIEVVSAFRRQYAQGAIATKRVEQALEQFRRLRILRYPHYPYLERIWDFRHNFSAYDACYLALTEVLNATLLTRDKAMASAHLGRGNIEVL